MQDDEPFVADWRARDALAKRVLPRLLDGATLAELRAFAHAGVEYPTGRVGDFELERELRQIARFADGLAPVLAEPRLAPVGATLAFALDGEPWRLVGSISDLRGSGRIQYHYDDARAYAYLDGWIPHLFLNAMAPSGMVLRTTWYSRNGCYVLPPVAGAHASLDALLRLYRDGLHRPLHFFPKSAWAYLVNGESLAKAVAIWQSTSCRPYGEDRDPAYRLALRGVDAPLDDEFVACAKAVFGPLLAVIEDDRLNPAA